MRRRSWTVVVALCVLMTALPAQAGPESHWIGTWIDPDWGGKLTITPEALIVQEPPNAPTRYVWTDIDYSNIAASNSSGLPPGNYAGYDAVPMTRDEIVAMFAQAWKDLGHAVDASDEANFKKVQATIGMIPPGTYARLRRFCVDDPKAGYDCSTPDEDEFFILLGDHIMKILLYTVATEDSYTETFWRR